ncbi:uncharacterized protein TNCV_3836071 [Trichonephila clavipes]|nr:uncharacterized protein TNCV_3836071 [Trichonephila clavipes]
MILHCFTSTDIKISQFRGRSNRYIDCLFIRYVHKYRYSSGRGAREWEAIKKNEIGAFSLGVAATYLSSLSKIQLRHWIKEFITLRTVTHHTRWRNHIRLERASQEQSNGTTKTPYDRVRQCRERKGMNAAKLINDGASTSAAGSAEIMQVDDEIDSTLTPVCAGINCVRSSFTKTHWAAASARFTTTLSTIHSDMCDSLWFLRSLKTKKII